MKERSRLTNLQVNEGEDYPIYERVIEDDDGNNFFLTILSVSCVWYLHVCMRVSIKRSTQPPFHLLHFMLPLLRDDERSPLFFAVLPEFLLFILSLQSDSRTRLLQVRLLHVLLHVLHPLLPSSCPLLLMIVYFSTYFYVFLSFSWLTREPQPPVIIILIRDSRTKSSKLWLTFLESFVEIFVSSSSPPKMPIDIAQKFGEAKEQFKLFRRRDHAEWVSSSYRLRDSRRLSLLPSSSGYSQCSLFHASLTWSFLSREGHSNENGLLFWRNSCMHLDLWTKFYSGKAVSRRETLFLENRTFCRKNAVVSKYMMFVCEKSVRNQVR